MRDLHRHKLGRRLLLMNSIIPWKMGPGLLAILVVVAVLAVVSVVVLPIRGVEWLAEFQ